MDRKVSGGIAKKRQRNGDFSGLDAANFGVRRALSRRPHHDQLHIGRKADFAPKSAIINGKREQPGAAALSVVQSDGSGRKSYGARSGPYPSLIGRLTTRNFLRSSTQSSPQAKANLGERNVVNDDVRSVADVSARDAQETERSLLKPQFRD